MEYSKRDPFFSKLKFCVALPLLENVTYCLFDRWMVFEIPEILRFGDRYKNPVIRAVDTDGDYFRIDHTF